MTAERREAASTNPAGGAENAATVCHQATDLLPDPADGAPTRLAPPSSPASPPAAFGRYQVRRALGSGGFGVVYLGHDSQLDRAVAIKVLHAGPATPQAESEHFLQEARRLAQLRHAGIVAVHDVGVQDGRLYIVSDYLDGPDLGRWLKSNHPAWPEAGRIAAIVADALAHAHARLIVHRDVKPAKILLAADRVPVPVDFGLALDEAQAGGGEKAWFRAPRGTCRRSRPRAPPASTVALTSTACVLYSCSPAARRSGRLFRSCCGSATTSRSSAARPGHSARPGAALPCSWRSGAGPLPPPRFRRGSASACRGRAAGLLTDAGGVRRLAHKTPAPSRRPDTRGP